MSDTMSNRIVPTRVALEHDSGERYCLTGIIGFDNAGDLVAEGKCRFVGHDHVAVDLSLADVASTAGIAVLMEWASWCNTQDIRLQYECVRPEVLDVARLNGVEMMLPIDPENDMRQL